MKTLLIDNYDSFTFNLYQLIGEMSGELPTVVRNDHPSWPELADEGFDSIVISPGPGRPERQRDFGISARAIVEGGVPTLGVCLGHQGICSLYGGVVDYAANVMHGRLSDIYHSGDELFAGILSPFPAVRYHSLTVSVVPDALEVTAWTSDRTVMAVRHRTRPMWGVQFHPESICTSAGHQLISNFCQLALRHGRPSMAPSQLRWRDREPSRRTAHGE